jgi:anti-sigma factor RsiW
MSVSDESLMAYADGEADAATRAIIETAMRDDPEIHRRIEEHRALRETMQGAFSAVLDESVPQRLIDAARGPDAARTGNVVDLARARRAAAAVDVPGLAWLQIMGEDQLERRTDRRRGPRRGFIQSAVGRPFAGTGCDHRLELSRQNGGLLPDVLIDRCSCKFRTRMS